MCPLQSSGPLRAVPAQQVTMQAPQEGMVAAAVAPAKPPVEIDPMPPPGTSLGAIGVGPLTSVVTGSPSGGSAFLSCPPPFPFPAKADVATTRAATSAASSSPYRILRPFRCASPH